MAVVLTLGAAWFLTRDGDDPVTTSTSGDTSTSPAPATASPPTTSPSTSPSSAPSTPSTSAATRTARPPTLAFRLLRDSYITVRVPDGPTLVSKVFLEGQRGRFDQKVLEVVNGRPSAVRFTVNGWPREPGPADEPETFTVRRR